MVGMWWISGKKYWVIGALGPVVGTGRIQQVREVRWDARGCVQTGIHDATHPHGSGCIQKGLLQQSRLGSGRHTSREMHKEAPDMAQVRGLAGPDLGISKQIQETDFGSSL